MQNSQASERLALLLEELEGTRRANGLECSKSYQEQLGACQREAEAVLLVHGTQVDAALRILQDSALRSRLARGEDIPASQEYLGLQDWVYTSAGVLHPARPVALVFGPDAEKTTAVAATPWDSGAAVKHLLPALPPIPEPQRREVILRYTLPSPLWRTYMAHYIASCFRSAADYLERRPHQWSDPQRALGPDPLSRVFEVRFQRQIPVREGSLKAIFLPRNVGGRRQLRYLSKLAGRVHVELYAGSWQALRERLRAWMREGRAPDREEASGQA